MPLPVSNASSRPASDDMDYYKNLASQLRSTSQTTSQSISESISQSTSESIPDDTSPPSDSPLIGNSLTGNRESNVEASSDYYANLAIQLREESEQEFSNVELKDATPATLVDLIKRSHDKNLERVAKRVAGRPVMRDELITKLNDPSVKQSLLKAFSVPSSASVKPTADILESGLLGLGTAGQTEEATVATGIDGLINMFTSALTGDWDLFNRVRVESGETFRAAMGGRSTREIGDILVEAGLPEPVAQLGGLVAMACIDPWGRVAKVAGQAGLAGPRQLLAKVRSAGAEFARKATLAGVKKSKRFTMGSILKKSPELIEHVLDPDNASHVTPQMLKNPKKVARIEINSMYQELDRFSNTLRDEWDSLRRTTYKSHVPETTTFKVFEDVSNSLTTNEHRYDLVNRIAQEFQRAKLISGQYNPLTKQYEMIANPYAKFGNLVNLKASLTDIVNAELRSTGEASSLGALAAKAKQILQASMEEMSPEYAKTSLRHKLMASTGRQLDASLGTPGRAFANVMDSSGEVVEGSRLGKVLAKDANVDALTRYWQNAPGVTEQLNLHSATQGLTQMAENSPAARSRLARLRAIATGSEFSEVIPKLTIVSLGGYAGSSIGTFMSNPVVAGMGLLGLAEASAKTSFRTTRGLTSILSGKANRLTPRQRALQRLGHATMDEAALRAGTGRQGDFEQTLEAPIKGLLD